MKFKLASLLLSIILFTPAFAQDVSESAEGSSVYIISPVDGEKVQSPVTVKFGLSGMGIAPAGIDVKHTGHHHLIVDTQLPDLTQSIPSSDNYRHFGKGQTETVVELSPGTHTLQLLLGDWLHRPHGTPVHSEIISITVE